MHLPRHLRRRSAAWATVALASAVLLNGPLPSAAADSAPSSKIDSTLLGAVQDGGEASFFVVLKDQADLSAARGKKSHAAKATAAYDQLRTTAGNGQRSLNSFLDKKKVGHRDFWIANAVYVTGGRALVDELAQRSDVARIVKEQTYKLDDLESQTKNVETRTATKSAVQAATRAAADGDGTPEWGVADIQADKVWNEYDDRGEGIVVASVDSGVQYDHPDLVANYRGNNGDGSFTHDYNWFDATGQCPTAAPCDNNGHGTHTMGTMAGKGGVGVAPGATWIAAKGCESSSCSDASLLAAGQWILAPTDHNGQNPRPDLAPNIVNNSWGGGDTTFYQDIVEAWNAAGIFEAFAAGNDGDGTTCSTTHAPGSQAPAYGVGAYDSSGKIASFSGFGPSLVGDIDATRKLLDEGKLDIYDSVELAPHSAATVTGKVTDSATGAALPGITVQAADGAGSTRTERLAEGHRVRVMDHPLTKLVVVDGQVAMVQLGPERSMLLRPPLVTLVGELFEAHWRRSRPYLREEGDLGPNDRRILQLMLSGLTDTATANQLGTSPRTVQRRLRALMDAAAVSSRVQLGWYAIRNNWV